MITYLSVSNLSVIKKTFVEFDEGLNVITGETGAGKSVLIGAVSLLIGERFNKSMIRDEEKPVTVEAVINGDFSNISNELKEEFDIDGEIILKRTVDKKGKNKIFVNGSIATVKNLKDLSHFWIDIHGQHEHQKLLDSKNHIYYLDSWIRDKNLTKYEELFEKFKIKSEELKKVEKEINETLKEKELYEFQINEIEELNLSDEDKKLDEKIKFLTNMEKIVSNLSSAVNLLKNDENSVSSVLSSIVKQLNQVEKYSEIIENVNSRLTSVYYEVSDCSDALENFLENNESDSEELNNLISRKFKIDNLIKKYGKTIGDVIQYKNNLKEKLDNLFFEEENHKKLQIELNALKNKLFELAEKVNEKRKKSAYILCKEIMNSLSDVDLNDAVFEVRFNKLPELNENCGMEVEFFISANKGFEPTPLSLTASGGEISRVMLALKEIFNKSDNERTLVFDEIDTGISGKTASKVSLKLKKLAKDNQLIVITHLPVVAAKADKHFHIVKNTVDESTVTKVHTLKKEESVKIIAKMISGEITESSISNAMELMGNSNV